MKRIFWTAVITVLIILGIPFLLLATGIVSMGATAGPGFLEETFANFAVNRTLATHAPDKNNPYTNDPKAIADGMEHYAAMCVRCHGGPGIKPEEFAQD